MTEESTPNREPVRGRGELKSYEIRTTGGGIVKSLRREDEQGNLRPSVVLLSILFFFLLLPSSEAQISWGSGGSYTQYFVGASYYAIKRSNITTSSVNLSFGLTSRKIAIEVPLTNTDEVCVDYSGGTAVCPAANTSGNDRLAPGTSMLIDDYMGTSISVIAASGTQTVYVRAWR